jgi:hypothetical protein
MAYSVVHIDEIEGAGPGGAVKFVRRRLGVEAFGINWFDVPASVPGPEHDETSTEHEDVNVIRFDPETTRQIVAGDDGCTMIAAGARRGAYEPRGPF